jgi:hypothetical protein
MKLVGTQCFITDFNLFDSKRDGIVYFESEVLKENLSSILKIFMIERFNRKS